MKTPVDVHQVFARCFAGCESLAYALSVRLGEGHICLDVEEYKRQLPRLLEEQQQKEHFKESDACFWVSPEEFAGQCHHETFVAHSDSELKPFVIVNGKAYLHRYFQYETQIMEHIQRLGANFHIITGGPGTGKTYSVSQTLVELFTASKGLKVALAAPTGKAAVRMNESIRAYANKPENSLKEAVREKLTGLSAKTIHRLLGWIENSVFFRYHENNRLPYDVLIVDECSMIDGAMMAKLLSAVGDHTQLYLLGDKDQLASVEAGSVFGDICRAAGSELLKGRVEVKTSSWRFEPDKGIGMFSREVIGGQAFDAARYEKEEQITMDTAYSQALFEEHARLYTDYIVEPDVKSALEKLNKVRFLCVTREQQYSVADTNRRIEQFLRKEITDRALFDPKEGFYHNQPVIITQNDYKLGLYNGDVGLIRRKGDTLYAFFEGAGGTVIEKPAGYLHHYDTVFAMTIHKSQGSEFGQVVVILPEKNGQKLLSRELLYTAVTRAQKKVLVQASAQVLNQCIEKQVARASGLEKRIKSNGQS